MSIQRQLQRATVSTEACVSVRCRWQRSAAQCHIDYAHLVVLVNQVTNDLGHFLVLQRSCVAAARVGSC
jgi:hypothetical protein